MDIRYITVIVDKRVVKSALVKAKKQKVATTATALLRYLLYKFEVGAIVLDISCNNFEGSMPTRMLNIDHDQIHAVRKFIRAKGINPSKDYVVNLLFSNYLDNDKMISKK